MIGIRFSPSSARVWRTVRKGELVVHTTGWAASRGHVLVGQDLGEYILDTVAGVGLAVLCRRLNGNFAVVLNGPDGVHVSVDAVRSIPLFYRLDDGGISVSDDVRELIEDGSLDMDSAVEYATAGYVTGPHTLFQGVTGLQAGTCLSWPPGAPGPSAERYYQYTCRYDDESPIEELCEAFDHTVMGAFERLIESLDGRLAIVPVSGGLDSRLVVSALKRCGYDNVLCLSYGRPGNAESARSQWVADQLGYRWRQVSYSTMGWKEALVSDDMTEYWGFSANGVSVPQCDDWIAIRALRQDDAVPEDAVFVPGHTGDFISGGHLKYLFDPAYHDKPHDFDAAVVSKHYSLWADLLRVPGVRPAISARIEEAVSALQGDSYEDLGRMYEYWEWQERQPKLIINAVRSYEFFGFSWRLPLWDRAVMDFWRRVPLALKADKYLYRTYLASYDPTGVFEGDAPSAFWDRDRAIAGLDQGIRSRARAALNRLGPSATMLREYHRFRSCLREYRLHPLGMARAYGALRFLFRDRSKRNALSLLLRDFLSQQYGLHISTLKSGAGNSAGLIRQ